MKLLKPMLKTPARDLAARGGGMLGGILTEACPELFALDEQMGALIAAAAKIPPPDTAATALTAVVNALAEGTVAKLDLVKVAGGDVDAIARWHRAQETLVGVLNALRAQQDETLRRAAARIVRALDEAAKVAVAELRKHPFTTERIRSAEQAIAAGKADEWAGYVELRSRYHEAYAAMAVLRAVGLMEDDRAVAVSAVDVILTRIEHPEQVWHMYHAWRRFGTGHRFRDGTTIGRAPWPDPQAEPEPFLDWLIGTEVDPWVPTAEQIAARQRDAALAAREIDDRRAPSGDPDAVGNRHERFIRDRDRSPAHVID